LDNWKPRLDESKAIVVMMSCFSSALPEDGSSSLAASVGGRVAFGYPDEATHPGEEENCKILFNRLNGTWDDDNTKRTVGKAYGDGTGYWDNLTYRGGVVAKWTTLNPAPNAAFLQPGDPNKGRKGAGCIIFDTYMQTQPDCPPNWAVVLGTPAGPVSDRWWFANESGNAFLVSFDFDAHAPGGISLRAIANCCKNRNPTNYGAIRMLSGDRQTYGQEKDWSF
jgi:hypothetical protein